MILYQLLLNYQMPFLAPTSIGIAVFNAEESFLLASSFEFRFARTKARWLNMLVMEISALSSQCLNRRIPSIGKMDREVRRWVTDRNKNKVRISWNFNHKKARNKFKRHYERIIQN